MMTRLQFAVIFFLGWVSHTIASICPCVEQKIWYNHGLGLTPDIVQIQAMVANAGTPDEYTACLPKYDMVNNGKKLEYFYSLHSTVFVAPQTGTYTFWMACDNTCVLALNGVDILWLYQFTPSYDYTAYPANQTTTYDITEGECLNITVIQAEGEAADHVSIKVEYPDGTVDSPMSKHMCDTCPCDDDPCNDGTCTNTGEAPDGVSCDCPHCVEGDHCDTEVANCDDDICNNKGVCKYDATADNCYRCDCVGCWQGQNCEELDESACNTNPCENGGTCTLTGANDDCYVCVCTSCYTGKNCSIPIDSCAGDPCADNEECKFDDTTDVCYICEENCDPCYTGALCDEEIDNCKDDICKNGGICVFDPLQASCHACDCPECYIGDTCEIVKNPCENNPCLNGGTCIQDPAKPGCYYCECTKCFLGRNCEIPVENCLPINACLNGGSCTFLNDDDRCYECSCTPCWESDNCQKRKHNCNPNPCDHNGTCSFVDDGQFCYDCECTKCYKGRVCEIPVDKCDPNPCMNGGICTFKNDDDDCFECFCTPCWTGPTCTEKKNNCKPDPCQNGGTCSWEDDQNECYKCDCPVCYEGEDCQTPVDMCDPNPCKNGGICNFVNDDKLCYECVCPPCWTGPTCEDESNCWKKYGVQCQEGDCKPTEENVEKQCPDDCNCCVKPGCYDTGDNCEERCNDITAENVGLLSKECRRSCDFCCPCEGTCDLMFQKRGCWRDEVKRKLDTLVLNERDRKSPDYFKLDWSTWNTYLPEFVCRCAKAAAKAGFKFFGVQFYRECWAGNNWFYDSSGKCSLNKPCIDREFQECTWPDRSEEHQVPDEHYCCAGKNDCNYVYEIPVDQKVDPCYLLE